jgi:hypothetical protein
MKVAWDACRQRLLPDLPFSVLAMLLVAPPSQTQCSGG